MKNINNTLVSIIMPSYNSALTILDSIESVLSQTYKNWELLIIDDGSTDDSLKTLNAYENDPRIKLLSNQNSKGAAGARQTGISSSKGRYIAFLDSDDLWRNEKLQTQIDFMIKGDLAFSYTDYSSFEGNVTQVKKQVKSPSHVNYEKLLRCCNIGCLTVVLDKNKFSDLEFENHPKEDYAFWLKLLKQIESAYNLNEDLAFYRLSNNSLSGKKYREVFKQWNIIRHVEKNSLLKSIYCILYYTINGLIKHR